MIHHETNAQESGKLVLPSDQLVFRTDTNFPARGTRALIASSTTSNESETCQDDPTYLSPRYNFPCGLHRKVPCYTLGSLGFTSLQIQEIVKRCPLSCNVCDPNHVITVTWPIAPTSCHDNPNFRDKFGFKCFQYSGFRCKNLISVGTYSERDILTIALNCKESCGYCTAFPTKISGNHPIQIPNRTPSNIPSTVFQSESTISFVTERSEIQSLDSSEHPSELSSGSPSNIPSPTEFPSLPPIGLHSAPPSILPSNFLSRLPSHSSTDTPVEQPTNFPSKVSSKFPVKISSTLPTTPLPTSLPTYLIPNPSFETCEDDQTYRFHGRPETGCFNWVKEKPEIRCNMFHARKRVFIYQKCPLTCNKCYKGRSGTRNPTTAPTLVPSKFPFSIPSMAPSNFPLRGPTGYPSLHLSTSPSGYPSIFPSDFPSTLPITEPTSGPTTSISSKPSDIPTFIPTIMPSYVPSFTPTIIFSYVPSRVPSTYPSYEPSFRPIDTPSLIPSFSPKNTPSSAPTGKPTNYPTTPPSNMLSSIPSKFPSFFPSVKVSSQPSWTTMPSNNPTGIPSIKPSVMSSDSPSKNHSVLPTNLPIHHPSDTPSQYPSISPSEWKCKDDMSFRDNLGNSCSNYSALKCSVVADNKQMDLLADLHRKCPRSCSWCEVDIHVIHRLYRVNDLELARTGNASLLMFIYGSVSLALLVFGFIIFRRWKLRKDLLQLVNIERSS